MSSEYVAREKRRYEIGKMLDRRDRVRCRLDRALMAESTRKFYEDNDMIIPKQIEMAMSKEDPKVVAEELKKLDLDVNDLGVKVTRTRGGATWED